MVLTNTLPCTADTQHLMLTRLPSVTMAPLQQGNKPWAATQDADADGCLDCELLNTMTKANKQNKAQKKGAALTNRALGL